MSEDKNKAISVLNNGGVVILPTDTLNALCVDATDEASVPKIYDIKQRERVKSLPVFYASIEDIKRDFEMDSLSEELGSRFWPGQLSVVLKRKENCRLAPSINVNDDTVSVRIPDNKIILDLIKKLGKPITATSANISGSDDFIESDEIGYIGECEKVVRSLPSTIILCESGELKVLREGVISQSELNQIVRNRNIS